MDWLNKNFRYLLQAPASDGGSSGGSSPTSSESTAEEIKPANSQKMEENREEREEKDKTSEDQLIVIHGAKIKFNAHLGEFKVLSNVPTTQNKFTGTIVENQISNFIFYDGFILTSLSAWQEFGTVKIQDNEALIKKSIIPGIGIMPGSSVPESGNVEFLNCGQVHCPSSIDTQGAPLPEQSEDETEHIYYTKDGLYLGGLENSSQIFLSSQAEYDTAKNGKNWDLLNKESKLLKDKKLSIPHVKFVEKASTIFGESSAYRQNIGIEKELSLEMMAIASVHKINKVAYGINSAQAKLFRNKKIVERNSTKMQLAVAAIISSLTSDDDVSNGATMWDGAEQAGFSIEDDRFSTGKFEIHMNSMGWSISDEHHNKWKIGLERLGASFKAPKEKYTPGKNPNNKYATAGTIALESRAVYLGTIFWKELKTRKKKPDEKK